MKSREPIPTLSKVVKEKNESTQAISDKELFQLVHPIIEKHTKQMTRELVDTLLSVLHKKTK